MLVPFVAASFLCAALLFLVQPMVARMVLPAFGGSPQVWTTTMLFFQTALLAGYAYTHYATTRIPSRRQPWVHLAVALVPLALLPIALDVAPSGSGGIGPSVELLAGLAIGVAAPFVLVATSGPLIQRWLSWTDHPAAGDPYFLFAAGNLGSAAGLLAYPFFVERVFSVTDQSRLWAAGYLVAVALLAWCAVVVRRRPVTAVAGTGKVTETPVPIARSRIARWVALAFVPSSLMLGVTTVISTDVAAIPLIWVVPLGLYLLTFAFAFSRSGPDSLRIMRWLAPASVVVAFAVPQSVLGVRGTVAALLAMVFFGGLLAHGLLSADRPEPAALTRFYLAVAVGGALGGLFNGLVAPLIFPMVLEHAVAAVSVVALAITWRPLLGDPSDTRRPVRVVGAAMFTVVAVILVAGNETGDVPSGGLLHLVIVGLLVASMASAFGRLPPAIIGAAVLTLIPPILQVRDADFLDRTFFGVHRVLADDPGNVRYLHGTTIHGTQDQTSPEARREPSAYYDRRGPMGDLMAVHGDGDLGILGLGVGGIAAYGRPGQVIVFHEIDPLVIDIANDWFTFLADTEATVEIVLGDGRLTIGDVGGRYEWLIADAFTSDAIPVHLVTVEAIEAYLGAVEDGGTVVFHISNRYLDLEPVMRGAADHLGLRAAIGHGGTPFSTTWVALSTSPDRIDMLKARGWSDLGDHSIVWTDQRSNLLAVLR